MELWRPELVADQVTWSEQPYKEHTVCFHIMCMPHHPLRAGTHTTRVLPSGKEQVAAQHSSSPRGQDGNDGDIRPRVIFHDAAEVTAVHAEAKAALAALHGGHTERHLRRESQQSLRASPLALHSASPLDSATESNPQSHPQSNPHPQSPAPSPPQSHPQSDLQGTHLPGPSFVSTPTLPLDSESEIFVFHQPNCKLQSASPGKSPLPVGGMSSRMRWSTT